MYFKNRVDAGRKLSHLLQDLKNKSVVVYALPRGGVVVAKEIARLLEAPLDLILAHKIGHPYNPEFAIGAISESGCTIVPSRDVMDEPWFKMEKEKVLDEIKRRRGLYLKGLKKPSVRGKIAILVDDGIATGLTMKAGLLELKKKEPEKIIVVVPVAPKSTADFIREEGVEFVGEEVWDDEFLGSVGAYYDEFPQVEDSEVIQLLNDQNS